MIVWGLGFGVLRIPWWLHKGLQESVGFAGLGVIAGLRV